MSQHQDDNTDDLERIRNNSLPKEIKEKLEIIESLIKKRMTFEENNLEYFKHNFYYLDNKSKQSYIKSYNNQQEYLQGLENQITNLKAKFEGIAFYNFLGDLLYERAEYLYTKAIELKGFTPNNARNDIYIFSFPYTGVIYFQYGVPQNWHFYRFLEQNYLIFYSSACELIYETYYAIFTKEHVPKFNIDRAGTYYKMTERTDILLQDPNVIDFLLNGKKSLSAIWAGFSLATLTSDENPVFKGWYNGKKRITTIEFLKRKASALKNYDDLNHLWEFRIKETAIKRNKIIQEDQDDVVRFTFYNRKMKMEIDIIPHPIERNTKWEFVFPRRFYLQKKRKSQMKKKKKQEKKKQNLIKDTEKEVSQDSTQDENDESEGEEGKEKIPIIDYATYIEEANPSEIYESNDITEMSWQEEEEIIQDMRQNNKKNLRQVSSVSIKNSPKKGPSDWVFNFFEGKLKQISHRDFVREINRAGGSVRYGRGGSHFQILNNENKVVDGSYYCEEYFPGYFKYLKQIFEKLGVKASSNLLEL